MAQSSQRNSCTRAISSKIAVVAADRAEPIAPRSEDHDGAEILARPSGPSPISALAWNAAGTRLAFGTDDGEAGVISL
jgi:hypothetical protein